MCAQRGVWVMRGAAAAAGKSRVMAEVARGGRNERGDVKGSVWWCVQVCGVCAWQYARVCAGEVGGNV